MDHRDRLHSNDPAPSGKEPVNLTSVIHGERFRFADLREVFAKANEEKSGDQLANLAARTERERVAAKSVLADLTVEEILDNPLIDPDTDEFSRLILGSHDRAGFEPLRRLTIGELREWILGDTTSESMLETAAPALTPEIVAGVAKLMSNKDLVLAASKVRVVTRCRNTMGERGVLGIRIQPNHPCDDISGILLATLDGLLFGCGDAVIGVNPATDSVPVTGAILNAIHDLIGLLKIPTQSCCLSHITTQLACLENGVPIDLLFQSVAGTEGANSSFGISLALLREGQERVLEHHAGRDVAWVGTNAMYFETGQGSALSAGAHCGVDQLTLEARAYGVARAFAPFLVNSVVGFIGPEYLFDERQIIRAGLEDHFMGKLLGLPMGVDVCYTNHAQADQNSADNLLVLLSAAGCNYVMGVPCSDDVMLNYQSTSFHDALAVRRLFGLLPAPEFAAWLDTQGLPAGQGALELERRATGQVLELVGSVIARSERVD
jgi:ethanolamine ammonia-lyase large subunit